jgi:hypothetical protein
MNALPVACVVDASVVIKAHDAGKGYCFTR